MKKTRMEEIAERLARVSQQEAGPWENIIRDISKGYVIPVISNSFRIEQIFREVSKEVDANTEELSIYEQLAQVWASEIGYPGEDRYNLARVANYFIEQIDDSELSKAKYLMFLSNFLLAFSEADSLDDFDLAEGLMEQIQRLRFSDLVRELDYPRFPPNIEDPLRLLARFPLPVYITTSYFDFMERALEAEGKTPETQICFWSGEMPNIRKEHRTDLQFTPSVTNPLVYHFYGLEDYPGTIVLSQDDFLDFLMIIAMDTNPQAPLIPLYLRRAVAESKLLFLGFQLSGWDFRILFRLIMKFRVDGFSSRSLLVPTRGTEIRNDMQLQYLRRYFGSKSFDVEWSDPELFIQKLWDEWNALR